MWHGKVELVERFIAKLVAGRLSRADAADLVTVEEGGIDLAALWEEAAAIRKNLEEIAGDCTLGRDQPRPDAGRDREGNARLADRCRAGQGRKGERARPDEEPGGQCVSLPYAPWRVSATPRRRILIEMAQAPDSRQTL